MSFGHDAHILRRRHRLARAASVTRRLARAASVARRVAGLTDAGRLPGWRGAACVATAALLLGGCQATETYFVNRGLDATDVVRAQVMAGKGGGAAAELTQFCGAGLVLYRGTAWGWGSRSFERRDAATFTFDIPFQIMSSETLEAGSDAFERMHKMQIFSLFERGQPLYVTNEPGCAPWLSARASLTLFLGFDIELRGGEVLDFVAGLAGFDPSHDDASAASASSLTAPIEPPRSTAGEMFVRIAPPAQVIGSWPPLAAGTGRLLFFGDDYAWVGLQGGFNWEPQLSLDGTPVEHAHGRDVYFFMDVPAGERVLAADGLQAATVHIEAGATAYLEMTVKHLTDEESADAGGAPCRLCLTEHRWHGAEPDLDGKRFVGQASVATPGLAMR